MSNNAPRSPFCIRLTLEERSRLEREAGDMSLSVYVRSRLFASEEVCKPRRGKRVVKDWKEVARLLAWLGQSRIASNLNQLARAANSGALPVTQEVSDEIHQAYEHIVDIRRTLMEALFIKAKPGKDFV